MGIRFAMGVELEQHDDLSGSYLEGPVILSYTLAGNEPEARLYFQHNSCRMPLMGNNQDHAAMFGMKGDDLNDVFDQLGEPSTEELLAQFQAQGRNRRSIERTLEGPYFVRTNFDPNHAAASATKYRATAPTETERLAYAQVRDDLLSRIAVVLAQIKFASSTTLEEINRQASDISQDYRGFLSLVEAEKAAIFQKGEAMMKIRSDFRKAHAQGYACLQRYQPLQDNLYLALSGWTQSLLSAMSGAARSNHEYVYHSTSLDRERLSVGALLASRAHELAKSLYQGVYRDNPLFPQYLGIFARAADLAQNFIRHADTIQRGMDTLEKQRGRFAKAHGSAMAKERGRARKLVANSIQGIEQNRGILAKLDTDGSIWGLDKVKSLLLMKMEELRHKAEGLQRDYDL